MEIETDTLMQRLGDEKKLMLNTGIILMIVAVILSFITTSIIASLIVKPIKKLDSHVAMIRDEKDKEKLKGKEISIRTKAVHLRYTEQNHRNSSCRICLP